MPGSRVKEVRMNLPAILESATILGPAYEYLLPVAPTLDRDFLQSFLGQQKITLVPETLPALYHSRVGIIASGTATVEAAMMNLPFVMVYRVSPLTYMLGKPRVKVPRFAMVNLIADEEVVPELVQDDFTAAKRSRPYPGHAAGPPHPRPHSQEFGGSKSPPAPTRVDAGSSPPPSRPRRRNHPKNARVATNARITRQFVIPTRAARRNLLFGPATSRMTNS